MTAWSILPQLALRPVGSVAVGELEAKPQSDEIVARYRALLRAGGYVRPIWVQRDGARWVVLDGNHRLAAAKLEGVATVQCDEVLNPFGIRPGSWT